MPLVGEAPNTLTLQVQVIAVNVSVLLPLLAIVSVTSTTIE